MEKVQVSQLRENLPLFLKKVQEGKSITITSRGRDLAKLVPLTEAREVSKKKLKNLRKTANVGDVLSSVEAGWDAIK
jgi:prevent-host-death family protein